MKTYKSFLKRTLIAWGVVGATAATIAIGNNASATDKLVYPADLVSGYCGSETLTVSVDGHHYHVPCDNVDTHTGAAYFDNKLCFGYGYSHCYSYRVHIQLPVLKIKKLAYRQDHLITTHASDDFHINVSDNGSYHKNLSLKSKQRRSLIVSSGHYSIHETAAGYNESIDCGHAGRSHTGSITVGVHPGAVVECAVINKLIPVHPPVIRPTYYQPAHCSVTVHGSLWDARAAYSHQCHVPRVDCDPVHRGWTCSSEQIGARSGTPDNRNSWRRSLTVIAR